MRLEIKATNIELTESIVSYIRDKILSVDKFLSKFEKDKEVIVKVEVGKTTSHHRKGKLFRAEANLALGKTFLRSVSLKEDLYSAITEVKDKLQREIKKYKTKGYV